MRILLSLIALCVCFSLELDGQSSLNLGNINFTGTSSSRTVMYGNNESLEISSIEGSPYLMEEFASTNMVLETDGVSQNATFITRFNIYSNGFEVEYNGEIQFLDASAVKTFEYTVGDKQSRFLQAAQFKKAGFDGKGFLQLLSDGKAKLLAKEEISIKEVTKREFGKGDELSRKFYREKTYYINISDEFNEFKSFKESSLEIFGDKSEQVKDFVKSEKLKFKNEDDIQKAVDFFNGL
ncbi:MAG: hypothetical protein ACJAZV_001070 [Roseivirga sp.]|jgi:hypothetical protein